MRPLYQVVLLCCLLLGLTGCLRGGAPPFPAYETMDEALSGVLDRPLQVVYQEPFGPGRAMVLFRTDQGGLSQTLLEQVGKGRWRMTSSVGLGGPLPRLGALSYGRGNLGQVETKQGGVTHLSAEAHVVYGETFDPAITWVELTLDEPGAQPIRTLVRDGLWVVTLPPRNQNTWFDLRAGDARGERFAASVGSRRSSPGNPVIAPQYHDAQLGVRFYYPTEGAFRQLDEQERLVISVSRIKITIERRPRTVAGDPEEQLVASTPAETTILEHETRTLGGYSAGYLLAVEPEPEAGRFTYEMRHLVPVADAEYVVTCTTPRIYERSVWESNWRPVCDQTLARLELGD